MPYLLVMVAAKRVEPVFKANTVKLGKTCYFLDTATKFQESNYTSKLTLVNMKIHLKLKSRMQCIQ